MKKQKQTHTHKQGAKTMANKTTASERRKSKTIAMPAQRFCFCTFG
jgi:hypothetical protein